MPILLTIRMPRRLSAMRRFLLLLLLLVVLAATMPAEERFSYIYKQGGHTHIRSNAGVESMVARSKRWPGEYVWVKRAGRQYLIRDAATLAEVRKAFAGMHAYEPTVRAAHERLRPAERQRDKVERQIDRISDRLGDDEDLDRATRQDLERQLRQLEREFRQIEPGYVAEERETERMERELDRLEAIAEERFEKIVLRAISEGRAERVD